MKNHTARAEAAARRAAEAYKKNPTRETGFNASRANGAVSGARHAETEAQEAAFADAADAHAHAAETGNPADTDAAEALHSAAFQA